MDAVVRPTGLRDRRRVRTRGELLEAGLSLFTERGYDDVTVEAICASADVSVRTFFRYFGSKDSLLVAPAADISEAVCDAMLATPDEVDAWSALAAAAGVGAALAESNPRFLLLAAGIVRDLPDVVASSATPFVQRERAIISDVRRRLPRTAPPHRAALLTGLCTAAVRAAFDTWVAGDAAGSLVGLLRDCLTEVQPAPGTPGTRPAPRRRAGK